MLRLQVDLLGPCRVARIATGEEVAFKTRKTRCLLGLLLLSPGQRMNREQLASLLWDPAPEALARSSLRQALRELREMLYLSSFPHALDPAPLRRWLPDWQDTDLDEVILRHLAARGLQGRSMSTQTGK